MAIQPVTYTTPRADLGEALSGYQPGRMTFVAERVLPPLSVPQRAATITVVTRQGLLTRANVQHANGAGYNRVNLATDEIAYKCGDVGLESQVTRADRELYRTAFDAELKTAENVRLKMLIDREIRCAGQIFDPTTNWPSGTAALYTDHSGAPWDAVGSDAMGHVAQAKEYVMGLTGLEARFMVIGSVTYNNLKVNTAILAKLAATPVVTADVIRASMAAILDLDEIIVGQGVYSAVDEGATFTGVTRIWSDDYALVFVPQEGTLNNPGVGRSLVWGPLDSGNLDVETYPEPQTRSLIVGIAEYRQEKVFDASFGHLIKVDA
jgi:hypothetical protein